jgi:AhpD family alkylhydroperoxidase
MTHIEPRPGRGSGLFVRFVYAMARRRLGQVPAPIRVMAHHRQVLAAVGAFEMGLERATKVDKKLKALASLKAGSLVGCRFCIDIGTALALGYGLSEDKLLALPFYETSDALTPLERDVIAYAVHMTETPSAPPLALFRRLEDALGKEGMVELTAEIAWENFRARFNHAVGAQEEGYSSSMVCMLPPSGFTPEDLPAHG